MTTTDLTPEADRIPRLLTYRDAAEILGVTAKTIYNMIRRGELRAAKIGGSVRIDPEDLRALIARSKGGSNAN